MVISNQIGLVGLGSSKYYNTPTSDICTTFAWAWVSKWGQICICMGVSGNRDSQLEFISVLTDFTDVALNACASNLPPNGAK